MATEPAQRPPDAASSALPTVEEVIRHRLSTALGGWRGSLEVALPTIAFVVVWSAAHDLRQAVVAAGALALMLAVLRIAQRQGLQHVFSAVFATAIAAFFALRSGRAEDAFLPGILASVGFGLGSLLSVAVRWPAIGFMVGAGDPRAAEDPFGWRRDPAMVRVCQRLTLVLVGLYAVRVAVMLPLYLAGNVPLLGVAKVGLSWPAWAAALAVMGAILMRGETPQTVETADSDVTLQEHVAREAHHGTAHEAHHGLAQDGGSQDGLAQGGLAQGGLAHDRLAHYEPREPELAEREPDAG